VRFPGVDDCHVSNEIQPRPEAAGLPEIAGKCEARAALPAGEDQVGLEALLPAIGHAANIYRVFVGVGRLRPAPCQTRLLRRMRVSGTCQANENLGGTLFSIPISVTVRSRPSAEICKRPVSCV
jgi:hypothetical protein